MARGNPLCPKQKWNRRKKSGNNSENEHKPQSKTPNKIWTNKRNNEKNSIRQGGGLSVIEYATLIDEISKDLTQKNKECK